MDVSTSKGKQSPVLSDELGARRGDQDLGDGGRVVEDDVVLESE